MKRLLIVGAAGLALVLQACNRAEDEAAPAPEQNAATPAMDQMESMRPAPTGMAPAATDAQAGSYSTTGQVASVAGQAVTINHQPVEALGWPAMTMSFQAPRPAMIEGLKAGTPVRFSFRKEGDQYVLTEVRRQ